MADITSPTRGVTCAATLERGEEASPGVFILEFRLDGGLPVAQPVPGQFYQFNCGGGREHMLPRPLSVHDVTRWDDEVAVLKFLVESVGWGTERLCSLEDGDEVGLLGPLGRGFSLAEDGKPLLVAGGMGIAPLFFLASEMDRSDKEYDLLAGFRSAGQFYRPLSGLKGGVDVYTDDGSLGNRGMVSGDADGRLEGGVYNAVYTCGPKAMMTVVAGISEEAGVPCQVSLASRMGCGIGACRGCVIEGRGGENLCVCSDGPVFESYKVAWTGAGDIE